MCLPADVPRLRQLVLAARDRAPIEAALRELLAAPSPHHDPDVAAFGLANAVLTAGCDFVEVVSPVAPDTAAGRWLDRHGGDGGYMLMVDGPRALTSAERLAALGVREVHRMQLADVVDVHLHPKDSGGVLLALDAVDPPGSWRWGGPAWTGRASPRPGGLREVTVEVRAPDEVARRWAELLDLPTPAAGDCRLVLGDGRQRLSFTEAAQDASVPAITAARIALPVTLARTATVGGVALQVVPLEEEA
jgi:hypothetical protein